MIVAVSERGTGLLRQNHLLIFIAALLEGVVNLGDFLTRRKEFAASPWPTLEVVKIPTCLQFVCGGLELREDRPSFLDFRPLRKAIVSTICWRSDGKMLAAK